MSGRVDIPVLETERLRLVAPDMADFEAAAVLYTGPRAVYMSQRTSRQEAWLSFASEAGAWVLQGFGYWSVRRRTDGEILGAVGVAHPPAFAEIELGWHLYDGFEGQGFATEAARAARDWAFRERGLDTLVSYIDPENARSIAVAERLGARRDPSAPGPDPTDLVYRHRSPEELAA